MFKARQFAMDVVGILMSAPSLVYVPFKAEWKMHLAQELDIAVALEKGRNGRYGAFGIVEMPEGSELQRNVSGVIENQKFNVTIIEQVDANMSSKGTNIFAEEIMARVKDVLHLHADDNYGTIVVDGRSQFVKDYPGCIAYRIPFVLPKAKSTSTARTGTVTMAYASGLVTLSCAADPTAKIFFTVDETCPTNQDGGNAGSTLYSGPFPAVSGDVIRAIAYADNKNQSEARKLIIP